jgi:uncharacterized membrane protein
MDNLIKGRRVTLNLRGILIIAGALAVIALAVAFLATRDGIGAWDIAIVVAVLVAVIFVALFLVNRWSMKKMGEQQDMIEKTKTLVDIYVIDKKRERPANANLPKAVSDAIPKIYRFMKLNIVQAKVGKQIVKLICEKQIYDVLQSKKNFKVELAGLYIVSVKGVKTADEKNRELKEKKKREKIEKANQKLLDKKK